MLQQRETIRLQHRQGFGLGEERTALTPNSRENPPDGVLVYLKATLLRARAQEPLRIAAHGGERTGCVLGELVVWDAVLFEDANAHGHIDVAKERRKDRLLAQWRNFANRARDGFDVGHGLRCEQNHQPVDVRVAEYGFQSGCVAIAGGIADHVDGIGKVRGRWQLRLKGLECLGSQFGELESMTDRSEEHTSEL